ncbi:MAG: NAD(P)-dependent alcohol dehydrogenase [Gammaproteobacteria bacterium]|nr:NAD(P)-dependent alcohol dehydrogenase [Gammaproteobacteria bacterium]
MKTIQLTAFGLENLQSVSVDRPTPGPGEVLVKMGAASVNPRDYQIITGQFTPDVAFPLIPLSDGAGEVVAIGDGVSRVAVGELVTPLFFPNWISGEALGDERKQSSGLELPGTLREYAVYPEQALALAAEHLSAEEAACYPCAGLTAWTSLVTKSQIEADNTVLVMGTGGVALMGLQLAKALGARVIILSSSDERLAKARELGADHCINYHSELNWGEMAYEIAGHGVDAVLEIGGSGTLENSLAAIRHGGHINIIGYMAGVEMGITVFPLIIKNANLHGIGTGNREDYEAMMRCVQEHQIRPVIAARYPMQDTARALDDLQQGGHCGKRVINIA